jgi:hypothetical protein
MAELGNFDANQHEPMNDFDVIPDGSYIAMATQSRNRNVKNGDGYYLEIEWTVSEDGYNGRKLWSRHMRQHSSEKAVKIGDRQIASICRAVNVLRPRDSEELHNKLLVLRVGAEKDDRGETRNYVKGFKPLNKVPAQSRRPSNQDANMQQSLPNGSPPRKEYKRRPASSDGPWSR